MNTNFDNEPSEILEIRITGITEDGQPFAMPTAHERVGDFPRILLDEKSNIGVGEIIMAEIKQTGAHEFFATPQAENAVVTPITSAERKANERQAVHDNLDHSPVLMGVVAQGEHINFFKPFNKNLRGVDFVIEGKLPADAIDGSVVLVKVGKRPSSGATPVTIKQVKAPSPLGLESEIAIANHEIAGEFPDEVKQASDKLPAALSKAELAEREDLRKLPLVTIDGADAKDFDDAVFAEECKLENGKDGFHLIVAIADVAHYIRENEAIDMEARARGNSTYFPDRVVPMLPERLCNDLCSLRPNEDRPTLAVHMYIDMQGKLVKHNFTRAVIHSHARLTYEQVQAAKDGSPNELTTPLLNNVINPLYEAYKVLLKNREVRGALDLDLPEPYIVMDDKGNITDLTTRERLDAHRLIEEFMVLANVAAATSLSTISAPCLYRIHPEPTREKVEALNLILKPHSLKLSGDNLRPGNYAPIIAAIREHTSVESLMRSILQSQQQAKYDVENIGHFGLALGRYAHFTSPIRRYADLMVHRSLVKNLQLPGAGAIKADAKKLSQIADDINISERKSQLAEWEARDRITTRFYGEFIGEKFEARIISVQRFGMFVNINNVAEGLLPTRLMGDDYYIFDEKQNSYRGRRNHRTFKSGDNIEVELVSADKIEGRLTFGLVGSKKSGGSSRPQHHAGASRSGTGKLSNRKNKNRRNKSAKTS